MPIAKTISAKPISAAEAKSLFSDLKDFPALVLAVSGGPDSTALMLLAARWRKALKSGPKLIAVTVDHGLRPESKREAAAVARLARKLGLAHRSLRWNGRKPATGLQQAARLARYRLLGDAARKAGSTHILTAHTLDDQAETVMIRMMRGSGLTGLGAMGRESPVPGSKKLKLVRPLLDLPKARLIATLKAGKIDFADDPSNRDPRFTRARLRGLMPALEEEGLSAGRLALLARRLRRADSAMEAMTDAAEEFFVKKSGGMLAIDDPGFIHYTPDEIALRLLGRAIARVGTEGPVELAKLETLKTALDSAQYAGSGIRRSLAGAIVTLQDGKISVERAPPRGRRPATKALTKHRPGRANHPKTR